MPVLSELNEDEEEADSTLTYRRAEIMSYDDDTDDYGKTIYVHPRPCTTRKCIENRTPSDLIRLMQQCECS